jgi:hypothetical protein
MTKRNLIAAVVDDELNLRIKEAARKERCSVSQLVRNLLDDATARKGDQHAAA